MTGTGSKPGVVPEKLWRAENQNISGGEGEENWWRHSYCSLWWDSGCSCWLVASLAFNLRRVKNVAWCLEVAAVSSENFIILAHTFRPLIHFELIFVYGVRWGPISFCYMGWSVIPAPFVEKTTLFPIELSWLLIVTFNVLSRRIPLPPKSQEKHRIQ